MANGSHTSDLIEVEVKAHVRVIDRSRWRKTCQCSDTPEEVSAPPVPRLFPRTMFGISVWARLLFELYAANRPLRRVAAWFEAQGLPVSPGTLSDGHDRIVELFAPLSAAILAHLQKAPVVQADENTKAAKRILGKALGGMKDWELNSDKAPPYAGAIAELKAEGRCRMDTRHRQVKYLNNVVEADNGKLKLLIRPVRGFKTLKTAYATIKGFEVMRALRKGQAGIFALQGGIVGEVRIVERAFGLIPGSWCRYRTAWPVQKHKATTSPPGPPHPFVRFATEPVIRHRAATDRYHDPADRQFCRHA